MKKEMIVLLLLGILFVSPFVLAQEQAQTYSGFGRFIDNVKLFFSSGDAKVRLALEIREKEIYSAMDNSRNNQERSAIKNLENAHQKLKIVNEEISLNVVEEIKENVDGLVSEIESEENLSDNFEVYVLEEKKTQLLAELTQETFEYCKELASEDYNLMLQEERCNPETAPDSLKKELGELKEIQEEAFVQLMLEIRSCIDDPGTCNCETNVEIKQKAKCEKMVALAVKCEYKDDKAACTELESMKPVKGDSFAESFVPVFLRKSFENKSYMIDYDIEHSDVPPECYHENERVKTQCAVFREKKELSDVCWDEKGNFLVEKCGGPKEDTPTMQESIPQCYDEENNFLEEKCGNITIIWKDGLINYIIETEINKVIDDFENASEQHTIDINQTEEKTGVLKVEGKIMDIEEDVKTWVVDHPVNGEEGDDGLTWEVKTDTASGGTGGLSPEVKTDGNGNGDDGLGPEVKTDTGGDGTIEKPAGEDSGGMAPGTTGTESGEGDSGSSGGGESSGEGESAPTGEAIKEITPNEDNFLTRFFRSIFGG
jgi:hypothetical protein